jgi:hypothetical protein
MRLREEGAGSLGLPQVPGAERQEDCVAEDDDDKREPPDQEQRVGGRGGSEHRSGLPRRRPGSRRPSRLLGRLLRRGPLRLLTGGLRRCRRRGEYRGLDARRTRRDGKGGLRLRRGRRRSRRRRGRLNRLRLRLDGRRGRRRRGLPWSRARHRLGPGRVRRSWSGLRGRPLGERREGGADGGAAEDDENRCLPQQRSTGAGHASPNVATSTAGLS